MIFFYGEEENLVAFERGRGGGGLLEDQLRNCTCPALGIYIQDLFCIYWSAGACLQRVLDQGLGGQGGGLDHKLWANV